MRRQNFSSSGRDVNQENENSEKSNDLLGRLFYLIRDQRQKAIRGFKTYLRLLMYAKPYWHLSLLVLILSIFTSFITILPTQITGVAINEIRAAERFASDNSESGSSSIPDNVPRTTTPSRRSKPGQKTLPIEPIIRDAADYVSNNWMPDRSPFIVTFYVLAAAFLFLQLLSLGIKVAHDFLMAKLGQTLIFLMRNDVYSHIQELSLRYFQENKTGDVMSRIVNDVNSLQSVMLGPVIRFVTDFMRLCWVLYFCLNWDWKLTLLSLFVGPFLIPITIAFGNIMRKTYRILRRKVGELNALIQDDISGIRIIKGFAREDVEYERFVEKNKQNMDLNIKVARIAAVFAPTLSVLVQGGSLVVLLYGGIKVLRGEMTAGMFVVFFPYIHMLYGPLMGITRFYAVIQRALASVERVFEVLDTVPEIKDKEDAVELPMIKGKVEFRDVNFSYSDDVEVLKNVNLKAEPGQMIAFVGPSGAGKTTAVNLVSRFYDPTKGDIFIDGYNIKDVKVKSIRKQMGIVLQEPFLFNDTLKSSIAYGKVDATDEEIIEAAKAANAHDFIQALPNGYETIVGERGVKLSGGQRQRISLARAILANPRILILDEATSSVDTETEVLIQNAIQRLVKNRTTFVIAHRLSTIHHADLIVVLDQGKVVEMGKHDELMEMDGLYRRLHDAQFKAPDEIFSAPQRPTGKRRGTSSNSEDDIDKTIDDEIDRVSDWPGGSGC
ncbi:ATP-binding cassette domain-containing protein [Candidatus Poribacteria bacterium]|nr:ATP-binding cassette domain-containing protein [Candidatus Poribacteria bacterium]